MVDSRGRCNTIETEVVWHGRKEATKVDVGGTEGGTLAKVEEGGAGKPDLRSTGDRAWESVVRIEVERWLCAATAKALFKGLELE